MTNYCSALCRCDNFTAQLSLSIFISSLAIVAIGIGGLTASSTGVFGHFVALGPAVNGSFLALGVGIGILDMVWMVRMVKKACDDAPTCQIINDQTNE